MEGLAGGVDGSIDALGVSFGGGRVELEVGVFSCALRDGLGRMGDDAVREIPEIPNCARRRSINQPSPIKVRGEVLQYDQRPDLTPRQT